MSEPIPREQKPNPRPSGQNPTTTGPSATSRWRNELHQKQKAGTYEEGARAVGTPAEVQKKTDPGKTPRGPTTETEQLRLENGELRARLDEETHKNDANRRSLEMLIESQIAGHLSDLTNHSSEARSALTQLETFVEATLVADDAKRHAGEHFDNTVKEYKASQMPSVLEAISLILDVANGFKTARGLVKAVKSAASESKTLDVAGAGLDLVRGGLSSGKSASGLTAGQERADKGDKVSAMTEAVSAKVDANDKADEAVKGLLFGREISAIRSGIQSALSRRNDIVAAIESMQPLGGPSALAIATQKSGDEQLDKLTAEIVPRLESVRELMVARDPSRGGGGELGQGTLGRSVFDLVAKDPTSFSLKTVTKLIVQAKNEDSCSERLEQTGFWIDAKDPTQLGVLALQLAPHAHQTGRRPWLVSKTAQFVPLQIGRPISTLVDSKVLPHDEVEVRGSAETLTTTKASWEVNRKYWLGKANADPYTDGGITTFGGH